MRKLRFATVGLGAVGRALTPALMKAGYQPVLMVGRDRAKDRDFAKKMKAKLVTDLPDNIDNIDLILVTIPTAKLATYAKELAKQKLPWKKLTFMHAGGPCGIAPFKPLADLGAGVAGVHPYQTFPQQQRLVTLSGITYGITGNRRGAALAKRIAHDLGGHPVMVKEEDRVLYHLSAVIACGFTAANLEIADYILAEIGITKPSRERATQAIAEETIRNVKALGTRAAMTGPAARGDIQGVARHVRALKKRMPELATLYQAMSDYILAMRTKRDKHDNRRS